MFKKIGELSRTELNGKKVFLRVDFNVPIEGGELKEIYRIKAHKETIDFLISAGARVALASHIDGSFKDVTGEINKIVGHEVVFEEDILNPKLESQLALFENIRKYEGEEKNDKSFALSLSKNFDLYVNDAFSVSHRDHTSIVGITGFLPSYAGFLIEKEINNLDKVLNAPAEGKTVILGGAKISTKLPVIKNFLDKAENILIAGVLTNVILKFKGIKVGRSLVEDSGIDDVLRDINFNDPKIFLPKDILVSKDKSGKTSPEVLLIQDLEDDQYILDIGPETIKQFSEIIKDSKIVIFNGPLGLAEVDAFAVGTKIVLDSIIRSKAFSVVGGGNSLAFIEKLNLFSKFSYASTGGGAMLEFLAGNKLPGLGALGYYGK